MMQDAIFYDSIYVVSSYWVCLLIISIALSIMERSGIRLPSSPNPLLPSLGEGEQDPIRLPLPDLGEGWGEG